jgi:hypothetical protein
MLIKTSTVYKYIKEHYPISKEHQVDNPSYTRFTSASYTLIFVNIQPCVSESVWYLRSFISFISSALFFISPLKDKDTYALVNSMSLVTPLSPCKVTWIIPTSPPWSTLLHESAIFHVTW